MIKLNKLSNKQKHILAIIVCLIASILVMVPYFCSNSLHAGVDMSFHLNRIYDLAQNIKDGKLFSYIETYAMNQVGTPINMVYGALPIYPFAVALILISNPVQAIYAGWWFIVLVSMLISYWCGLKYWQGNKKKALLFSFMYVLSAYNFSWMFLTFDVGQTAGYVFLPLIIYGTYSIFFREKKGWILLSFGMTGVVYSHVLSFLMYVVVVMMLIVIAFFTSQNFWRKTKYIIYAGITTLLMTSFYWSTLFTVYSSNKLFITKSGTLTTASVGLGDSIISSLNNNESIGALITILVFMGLFLWKKQNMVTKFSGIIGIVFFVATTNIFESIWNFINKTPIIVLQWTGRILCISNFFLAIFAVETIWIIISSNTKYMRHSFIVVLGITVFALLSNSYSFLNSRTSQTVINFKPSNSKTLPFSDYQITSKIGFNYMVKNFNEGVGSIDYWPLVSMKNYTVDIKNHIALIDGKRTKIKPYSIPNGISYRIYSAKDRTTVDLPFLNYNSYTVTINGKKVGYTKTKRSTIGVTLNKGHNNIKIVYKVSFVIKVAEFVSWITLAVIVIASTIKKIKFLKKLRE
ncbi:hypothetical protein LB941_07615 [Ligilactobacillus sp. WILCCON 0076]|uniref:YfhO family protein n=1 Tax=Ligilactobacillus ubinensis TaxID=2876789 RepID=A0A9X2FKY2_9LACO|nr:hypothetical protein [Ligilactobacillus ubinensis]MCP0887200.1 hypothetical protein [Ligilactobacillus ubinensis]